MMIRLLLVGLVLSFVSQTSCAGEVERDLESIAAAGPMGIGSAKARAAHDRLVSRGVNVIPKLLFAINSSNPVAANWYRSAYQRIVETESNKPSPKYPTKFLKQFSGDANNDGRVRRMVLRLIDKLDPKFRGKLIPTLLKDPEFRSDAVALAMQRGSSAQKSGKKAQAIQEFQTAFNHAREVGQITQAASQLQGLGQPVSIVEHMGFVIDWYLLGPFDAPGMSGFDQSFPPEKQVDLKAIYQGKDKRKIVWQRHHTDDRMGQLNLIRTVAQVKEAVGYAYTEFESPTNHAAQLRCGADDNCTVWLNGKVIFRRLQWLNGTRLDRFTADARIKKGTNRLLVKVCQGPQHKNPAVPNNWSLQLRFCDAEGAGIPLKTKLPPVETKRDES